MFRRLITAVGVAALAAVAAVPATTATPAAAASTDAATSGRLELVLDASGSMAEEAQGGTRIDIAKESLHSVIDTLPESATVGMRVYGATIDTGPGSCEDSQQVVEIGTGNRDELRAAIDSYTPLGETPIGYALQEAAKDLGNEGQRTIVLVSDGEPTCEPDPCVVAADLAAQGIDLKIDVVGLSVDAATREKLQCIAENGNGTYYDADDAETLTQSLTQLSTRAFRPFEVSGIPVTGGDEPAGAAELRESQQYVDTVPTGEEPLYYSVARTEPGSTLHFGTTVRSVRGDQSFFDISAVLSDGTECGDHQGMGTDLWGSRSLLTGSVSTWSDDPEDPCNTADEVVFEVQQNGTELTGAPFEIAVYEEPPLNSDDDLPGAADGAVWRELPAGTPTPGVVPGTSISDAPVLEPGSYDLQILTGETQVFAVPLDWGQSMQFQAVSAPREGALDDAIENTATFNAKIIGPVREQNSVLLTIEDEPRWNDLGQSAGEGESLSIGGAVPAVGYLNRTDPETAAAALPGYRFIEIGYAGGTDSETYLLPYTLTVGVDGEAGSGAPDYAEVDGLTSPVPAPADMIVPAPEDDADDESGEPDAEATPGQSDGVEPVAAESDSGLPVVPLLLGVGGIILLVGGGFAVARAVRQH